MFYEVYLSAVFIFNTLQKCRFFYLQFYKRLVYIIVTFCKHFKNKQTSLHLFELKFLIRVYCNTCFNFCGTYLLQNTWQSQTNRL